MSKNSIIKGTLILTAAGLLTRIIGFFYKIYLSGLIGARNLGVYQLIFPVYGICFTLYASGIQTALSKLIAEEFGKQSEPRRIKRMLFHGVLLSLSIALLLSCFVYWSSDYIALHFLEEADCAAPLRILCFAFPFCGITACINGYYYGLKKASVPAFSQLLEQIIRVGAVLCLVTFLPVDGKKEGCELAVIGIVSGEIASQLYNLISLLFGKKSSNHLPSLSNTKKESLRSDFGVIFSTSLPLTLNRLLINLLHSFEAVLIPKMLRETGLSQTEALSIYGIITGMSMPFLMFPSTITNSLSVLLLPAVSEAKAKNNHTTIAEVSSLTIKYSLLLGILSLGIFLTFGEELGSFIYGESIAGVYLTILAWLCPFLYVATTLGSILNGLGKMNLTFLNSVAGQVIQLILIAKLIPEFGMKGYFVSLLVSQLSITMVDFILVYKNTSFPFHAVNTLLKPSLILLVVCMISRKLFEYLFLNLSIHRLLLLLLCIIFLCVSYLIFLFIFRSIRYQEWKTPK